MVNKIIGFTVSKSKIVHEDVDIFNRGLSIEEMKIHGNYVYIWGINQINNCMVDGKYSLSFPLSDNLLDRNVLIYAEDNAIIIENDWLGSIPVFYNETHGIVSTLPLKCLINKDIYPEGLANFVEFGYSVFEQTPFKDVKFMRYFSKLILSERGLRCVYKDDPVTEEGLFETITDEKEVLLKLKKYINNIESATSDEILLPTSGGYDSRLLNLLVNEKSRIRSFTYGISDKQSESSEVIHAKKIAELLGTQWEQIELGSFHRYIDDWFKIYGFSTHLHGMYHIEFYKKIVENHTFSQNTTFLSGIVGDAWSGNVISTPITHSGELVHLAYSHGMIADKGKINFSYAESLKESFFLTNKKYLDNPKLRIIFIIRFKIILLSYLTTIPEYFGFPVWTPFLNFEIATSMLNLPDGRRKDRKWQMDIFIKNNLALEEMFLKKDMRNTLNNQAFKIHRFDPLNEQLLSKYFVPDYIHEINSFLKYGGDIKLNHKYLDFIQKNKYIAYCLRQIGIETDKNKMPLLYAYYVLKPLDKILEQANNDN